MCNGTVNHAELNEGAPAGALTATHVDTLDFRPVAVRGGRTFRRGGVAATEPYYYPSAEAVGGAQFYAELGPGEVWTTPQRGISIGTLHRIPHGVTAGRRRAGARGRVGRGSLIFQSMHDVLVLAEMLSLIHI